MSTRWLRTTAILVLVMPMGMIHAASIKGSKHDLGKGPTSEICVFCHTPHGASTQPGLTPLWNRTITNLDAFIPYASPTMTQVCPTRPSGISLVCLSCHDGTNASGLSAVSPQDQHALLNVGPATAAEGLACLKCHPSAGAYSRALVVMGGPDLRNDHPISMQYPIGNPGYNAPPDAKSGWPDVKLFDGKVECPTCHGVHDPQYVPFLRIANDQSQLCYRCHNK